MCFLWLRSAVWTDCLYGDLLAISVGTEDNYVFLASGDFREHFGTNAGGNKGKHGGYGLGEKIIDGCTFLKFAENLDLGVCNSLFKNRNSHMTTYSSGGAQTQIDYSLTRKRN